jgi:hypothetical protein
LKFIVRGIGGDCSLRADPVLPIEIPPGTTVETLVTEVLPALHAQWVDDRAPTEPLSIVVRIDGVGSWTARIRGRDIRVQPGEEQRPTLWVYTTAVTVERLLADALGPRRFTPVTTGGFGVVSPSDPRIVKRVALASGRIELAVRDDDGERLFVVLGFGDAARRPIDPEEPETVAEGTMDTLERAARGALPPEEALSSGEVSVRGSRLLAMQLALAVGPFYVPAR